MDVIQLYNGNFFNDIVKKNCMYVDTYVDMDSMIHSCRNFMCKKAGNDRLLSK